MRTGNAPELGWPATIGTSAVGKRLVAMNRCWPLTGESLLDVGCGNGAYTMPMARRFDRVEAIDVVKGHLEEFRAADPAANITVRLLDAADLDYPDATFDVVTMIEVLEHVADVPATLRQVERTLKPGGALVLTVPNRLHPFETHALRVRGRMVEPRRFPFLPWLPPVHRRFATARIYTLRSLRREVESLTSLRLYARTWVMPPFDRWAAGRRFIRPVTQALERTPARVFGVSIVAAFVKP